MKRLLAQMETRKLVALHRIAKVPGRGLLPWFRDPKAMKMLREELERRNEAKE